MKLPECPKNVFHMTYFSARLHVLKKDNVEFEQDEIVIIYTSSQYEECNGRILFIKRNNARTVADQIINGISTKYLSCDGSTLVVARCPVMSNLHMVGIQTCIPIDNRQENAKGFVLLSRDDACYLKMLCDNFDEVAAYTNSQDRIYNTDAKKKVFVERSVLAEEIPDVVRLLPTGECSLNY